MTGRVVLASAALNVEIIKKATGGNKSSSDDKDVSDEEGASYESSIIH